MSNYDYWSEDLNATEDILEHHGILGQKWGVRRYQNEDGSLTPEGRKRYLKGEYAPVRTDAMRNAKTIKRGTKMYRVVPNEDRANPEGPTFVTYLELDKDLYTGGYNQNLIVRNKIHGIQNTSKYGYEVEYELKEALKVPSREAVKDVTSKLMANEEFKNNAVNNLLSYKSGDIFVEAVALHFDDFDATTRSKLLELGNHPDVTHEIKAFPALVLSDKQLLSTIEPYIKDDYNKIAAARKKEIIERIDNDPDYAFDASMASVATNPTNRGQVFNAFKKKGFNAITDEHGVGNRRHPEGLDPLIIFEGADSLRKVSVKAIDAQTYEDSWLRGVKWTKSMIKKMESHSPDVIKWSAL